MRAFAGTDVHSKGDAMNRSTLERLAPLTGVAFVALFIVSFILGGDPPGTDDPAEEIATYWQDNEAELIWSSALVIWGSVLAVWFGASVRTALRRVEGEPGRLSALAFAGWVIFAIGSCAFAGFGFAAADVADEDAVSAEVVQTLSILAEDFFPIAVLGIAVAMIATAVAILRFGGPLPRWLGYLALLIGVAAVTPLGFFSFIAIGIWALIASVLLYQQGARGDVAAPPPSATA
jgi:hypothetical protein